MARDSVGTRSLALLLRHAGRSNRASVAAAVLSAPRSPRAALVWSCPVPEAARILRGARARGPLARRRQRAVVTKVNVVSAAIEPRLKLMLVAKDDIAKGEIIFTCNSEEITRERTWRTIQIDFNAHVKNDLLDYVDHSCEPNSVFDVDRLAMVSLRK